MAEWSCSVCGVVPSTPSEHVPLGWSSAPGAGGEPQVVCADCTRTHARDIEAKLDEEYWS